MRCEHPDCPEPEIRFPATAWHRVVGWDRDRESGGTNAVALRKRTGVVVCNGCMERMKLKLGKPKPRQQIPGQLTVEDVLAQDTHEGARRAHQDREEARYGREGPDASERANLGMGPND